MTDFDLSARHPTAPLGCGMRAGYAPHKFLQSVDLHSIGTQARAPHEGLGARGCVLAVAAVARLESSMHVC